MKVHKISNAKRGTVNSRVVDEYAVIEILCKTKQGEIFQASFDDDEVTCKRCLKRMEGKK